MNYSQILVKAENILKNNFIKNPKLDSEILLAKILKTKRERLLISLNKNLNNSDTKAFYELINRRRKKEPIAYILGYKEFWKKNFFVNRNVLIPRPDSEILIEEALKYIKLNSSFKILDVGTGSGCLLLSILNERKKCCGVGIDLSRNAISVAKHNAKIQHLENRTKFFKSDIDNFSKGKYDFIVSNPPYIQKNKIKYLDEGVSFYEPRLALDGGLDGLYTISILVKKSAVLLKKNGKMIVEIDSEQVFNCKKILNKNNFYINKISKDLSNQSRCIVCTKIK